MNTARNSEEKVYVCLGIKYFGFHSKLKHFEFEAFTTVTISGCIR